MRAFKALLFVLCAFVILVACNSRAPEDIGSTTEAIVLGRAGDPCTTNSNCDQQVNGNPATFAPFCVDTVCCTSSCGGGARDNMTCSNVYSRVEGVDVYAGTGKSPGQCITLQIGQPCGALVSTNPCLWRGSDVNGGNNCPAPNDGTTYACYPCGATCPSGNVCTNNAQCASGKCDATGHCSACSCPAQFPACVAGQCTACTSNAQCAGNPNGTVCDTNSGQCVVCTPSNLGPCVAGCDTSVPGNQCFHCGATHQCPAGTICDPGSPAPGCVECLTYHDCTNPSKPVCSASKTCIPCVGDYSNANGGAPPACPVPSASVGATGPACVTGSCLQCDGTNDAQQCPTATQPRCDTTTNTHQCVQCNNDAQCLPFQTTAALFCVSHTCKPGCAPANNGVNAGCQAIDTTKPYCDTAGFCQQCTQNSDCGKNGAPAGSFCINNLCKQCRPGQADCDQTSATPVCNATGTCVACSADNRTGSGLFCPTTTRPACDAIGGGGGSCLECTAEDKDRCTALGLPECDLATNKCAGCLSNGDCTDLTKPICDLNVGSATYETCQPCNGDTGQAGKTLDCPAVSPAMPACVTGQCVQCRDPDNLTACSPALPVCFNNTCVECTSDAQCTTGPNGKCNLASHTCAPGCSSNANCAAPTPACDIPTSTCVQCEVSGDCAPGQICTAAHTCVGCTDNSQCGGATPICTNGTCVACQNDKGSGAANSCFDAAKPACVKSGPDVGKCVVCTSGDPVLCVAPTPACNDTTHTCVACKTNAQCTDPNKPICDANGACVPCGGDNTSASATKCPTTAKPACIIAGTKLGSCQECSDTDLAACTPTKPVCNTTAEADVCVECNVNSDCKGVNGVCNTNSHTCVVGCTSDANCSPTAPVCKLPDGFCVPCTPEKPGACSGSTPVCDPKTDTCVGCVTGTDCKDPTKPVCDPTTNTCSSSCTTSAQCPGDKPVCNPTTHTCTQCSQNSDCPPSAPICDPATGTCGTTCTLSSQCPGDKPVCNPTSHQCVQCTDNSNCPQSAPICDPSTGTCTTNCTASSQCPGDKPVCDPATKQCVQCQDDANCPSTAPHCDGTTHTCVAVNNPVPFSLEGGGCSCTTAGGGSSSSAVPALIGLGLAVSAFSRRRRDRRQAQAQTR